MPFSYHGFGPAAILLMVVCLVINEAYKKYKQHHQHH
jgi:hypothetical protein